MGLRETLKLKRDSAGSATSPASGAVVSRPGSSPVRGKKGVKPTGPSGALHDRRRRLIGAREGALRDLGGLMLEMYKRNRFREELLLDKCEEVLSIEVEVAHIDQKLFQLTPANSSGQRPIGRCECGSPIHPGQNFCGVCGRSFATLTQSRTCERCGTGLRPGDSFCSVCGQEAPDMLDALATPHQSQIATSAPIRPRASSHATATLDANLDLPAASTTASPAPLSAQQVTGAQPMTPPLGNTDYASPGDGESPQIQPPTPEQLKAAAKAEKERNKVRKEVAKQRAKAAREARKRTR